MQVNQLDAEDLGAPRSSFQGLLHQFYCSNYFRPLSDDEKRMNTPVVIFCNEHRREVTAAHSTANKQIDRTFTFDKVFIPLDSIFCQCTLFFLSLVDALDLSSV